MNEQLLYQWEQEIAAHLPMVNSWQQANVALFSYRVVLAGSSQQGSVARQVNGREQVSSPVKRWQRFLGNTAFDLEAFFVAWSSGCWEGWGKTS